MKQFLGIGFLAASAYAALKGSTQKTNPLTVSHTFKKKKQRRYSNEELHDLYGKFFDNLSAANDIELAKIHDIATKEFFDAWKSDKQTLDSREVRLLGYEFENLFSAADFLERIEDEMAKRQKFAKANPSTTKRNVQVVRLGTTIGELKHLTADELMVILDQEKISDIGDIAGVYFPTETGSVMHTVIVTTARRQYFVQAFDVADMEELVDDLQDRYFPSSQKPNPKKKKGKR